MITQNTNNSKAFADDFVIGHYVDYLEPANNGDKSKYICPICKGNDLSIAKDGLRFNCFNDDSPMHRQEIVRYLTGLKRGNTPFPVNKPSQQSSGKSNQKLKKVTSSMDYYYSDSQRITRRDGINQNDQPDKIFAYYHRDGHKWVKGKGDKPWTPYRLNEWSKNLTGSRKTYTLPNVITLVEGEQCVNTMIDVFNYPSFTFGGKDWGDKAIEEALKDIQDRITTLQFYGYTDTEFTLVIFPDNDDTGKEKANKVVKIAQKLGIDYRVIPMTSFWERCPNKGDIHNYYEAHIQGESLMYAKANLEKIIIDAISNPASNCDFLTGEEKSKPLDSQGLEDSNTTVNQDKPSNSQGLSFITYEDLLLQTEVKREMLIDEWLPVGETLLISAGSKVGKSLLSYDIIRCVINGEPFFPSPVKPEGYPTKKGKVLLIQVDESKTEMKQNLGKLDIDESDYPNLEILTVFSVEQLAQLKEAIKTKKPDLVIIDSLRGITEGKLNLMSDQDMTALMYGLTRFMSEHGITCILIHHNNKSLDYKGTSKILGSGSIVAACWGSWILEGKPGDDWFILSSQTRGARPGKVVVNRNLESLQHSITEVTEGDLKDNDNVDTDSGTDTKTLILNALKQGEKTNKEVSATTGKPLPTIKRILAQLKKDGIVLSRKNGKCTTYYIGSPQYGDPIGDPIGDPMESIDITNFEPISSPNGSPDHPYTPQGDPKSDPITEPIDCTTLDPWLNDDDVLSKQLELDLSGKVDTKGTAYYHPSHSYTTPEIKTESKIQDTTSDNSCNLSYSLSSEPIKVGSWVLIPGERLARVIEVYDPYGDNQLWVKALIDDGSFTGKETHQLITQVKPVIIHQTEKEAS